MTTYIDIHTITTLGANLLNRGQEGAPKTTTYGGVERQVLSSQSLKKAMRDWVKANDLADISTRTRLYIARIAENIQAEDETLSLKDAWKIAGDYLVAANYLSKAPDAPVSDDDSDEVSENAGEKVKLAIAAFSEGAMKQIGKNALHLKALKDEGTKPPTKQNLKKEFAQTLKEGVALDVALFGTMVANDKSYSVDAAAQVAYAISTNAFRREFDFYAAVDDLLEENGSAMLGDVEYGTSNIYRYATVSLEALAANLGVTPQEAIQHVETFLLANIKALPTSKQNSFAARVLPSFVNVSVRTSQPLSFVSAFETAVSTAAEAQTAFKAQRDTFESMYDEVPLLSADLDGSTTLPELIEQVRTTLTEVSTNE